MNNLRLKNKIILILLIPIIAILILSSNLIYDKYKKEKNMTETSSYILFTVKVSNLLTNLQKEREYFISYISSYGNENKANLENQIKISDESLDELNIFLDDFKLLKTQNNLSNKLKEFENAISNIKEFRQESLQLKISSEELINYYAINIKNMVLFFDDLLIYSNTKELSKSSQAYVSLLNVIEKAYSEKNIVKNIFEHNNISNEDYNNFISYVVSQNSYLDFFIKNFSTSQSEFYENEIKSNSFKEVDNFRELIYLKVKKNIYLSEIREAIGYGGLIDLYKDFAITQNDTILNKIQKSHTKMLKATKSYKKLENITNDENILLDEIQGTFDLYMSKAYDGVDLNNTKINDSKTQKALITLEKNIYGADFNKWEDVSSQRINSFEEIKKKIVEEMISNIKANTSELNNQVVLFLLFMAIFLFGIFVFILYMTNKISKSIIVFEENLNSFFTYSMREKDSIILNEINGNDEFAIID